MIDIGVNLGNSQLSAQAELVLTRALDSGIEHCVLTGTDLTTSQEVLHLAQQLNHTFPNMLTCTAGVHPHDAKTWTSSTAEELLDLLSNPLVVAVGEAGLDFNRNFSTPEQQTTAFIGQIELAKITGKPLFLHERDAFTHQLDILKVHRDDFEDAVIHCFTGEKKALFAYLDLGLHIGITGWVCDERRGQALASLVANIPLDRLMIETDAPYLLPRNIQPKPASRVNEPCYLPWIAEKIAACYGVETIQITEATSANARGFFGLDAVFSGR